MPLVYKFREDEIIHHQRMLVRALWIRCRFPVITSKEHSDYLYKFRIEYEKLKELTDDWNIN